ncbi:hypothetical protein [Sinomicrobium weinanense]|uniref:MORN repeat variant n=1 Tax=Sinomicrobium weinanense TaxID=2842200 RepID=A0A926Q5X7_9FLAO|nr:hypothetical protein [Sinomicrobium weinanense]MBC9798460.1 hypothetical protein [Sinomicrobium weinanense]MBU3126001.1 hypothetical protein [Sinomicrobium weinanense]
MKHLILLVCMVAFTACKAQQKDTTMTVEKFDIENYHKNEDKSFGNYYFQLPNGVKVVQSKVGDEYSQRETPPSPATFETYKRFHPNGILKFQGEMYINNGDWQKGVWKYYDEEGKLIKEVNYDKPYIFDWDDVMSYISKNNIGLQDKNTRIRRDNDPDHPKWYIEWRKEFGRRETVTLDGKTGKVLDTGWYPHEDN